MWSMRGGLFTIKLMLMYTWHLPHFKIYFFMYFSCISLWTIEVLTCKYWGIVMKHLSWWIMEWIHQYPFHEWLMDHGICFTVNISLELCGNWSRSKFIWHFLFLRIPHHLHIKASHIRVYLSCCHIHSLITTQITVWPKLWQWNSNRGLVRAFQKHWLQ